MRNTPAVFALLVALLALAVLVLAGFAAERLPEVSWLEAAAAAPVVAILALVALSLASRGRARHQRTLGRSGGAAVVRMARGLGLLALLLVATVALALGVFGILVLTDGLTRAPW